MSITLGQSSRNRIDGTSVKDVSPTQQIGKSFRLPGPTLRALTEWCSMKNLRRSRCGKSGRLGVLSAVKGTGLLHPKLSLRPQAAFQQKMLRPRPNTTLHILKDYTRNLGLKTESYSWALPKAAN
jgi:hypothetical protein